MKRNDLLKPLQKIKKTLDEIPRYSTDNKVPQNTQPSTNYCQCKDSSKQLKTLYPTYEEAKEALAYLKLDLHIYPCPKEKGWHLTKG